MSHHQSSYRQIFKATSLFGGVQIVNILIAIIRTKIVAVLLGPAGMGLLGMLTKAIELISSISNFGLGTSAVRDIATAHENGDISTLNRTKQIVLKLVWITGLLGAIIALLGAPWISELTFGNREYTNAFRWLSIAILFWQITSGQTILLQGMRQLSFLAKSSMLGAALSVVVATPCYYYFKEGGIVPAIILAAIVTFIAVWIYSKKNQTTGHALNFKDAYRQGQGMLKLGFLLSVSNFAILGESYIIRVYINATGSMNDVGFYNAGFAIIGSYVGMIFTAMATDFYPRLTGVAEDRKKFTLLINQQAEIALLILGPILAVFLIFIDWGIMLLYSKEFLVIKSMMHWAVLGVYFQAISWAMAFIFLAKGANQLFLVNEVIRIIVLLVCNVLGYKWGGLTGLGISFLIAFSFYAIQIFTVIRKKYNFYLNNSLLLIFIVQLLVGVVCFWLATSVAGILKYSFGIVIIGMSAYYSIKELDKRMQLTQVIKNRLRKNS